MIWFVVELISLTHQIPRKLVCIHFSMMKQIEELASLCHLLLQQYPCFWQMQLYSCLDDKDISIVLRMVNAASCSFQFVTYKAYEALLVGFVNQKLLFLRFENHATCKEHFISCTIYCSPKVGGIFNRWIIAISIKHNGSRTLFVCHITNI